jgi:hypothetical protein
MHVEAHELSRTNPPDDAVVQRDALEVEPRARKYPRVTTCTSWNLGRRGLSRKFGGALALSSANEMISSGFGDPDWRVRAFGAGSSPAFREDPPAVSRFSFGFWMRASTGSTSATVDLCQPRKSDVTRHTWLRFGPRCRCSPVAEARTSDSRLERAGHRHGPGPRRAAPQRVARHGACRCRPGASMPRSGANRLTAWPVVIW